VRQCDGRSLKQVVSAAAQWLRSHTAVVNALNVFPVPDGDTGTNMSLTMAAALSEIERSPADSVSAVARALAHGGLMGARGNSGVILSQILRGFAHAMDGKESFSACDLADAAQEAYDAETEKGTRKGVAFAVTMANVYQMGSTCGMWWVNWLGGFLAVPGLESLAKTLAERVGAGFQWNPQWQQQMTKLAGNVSKIQSQTHGEIMNMIHQGYERRSQIMDRVHERWTRAFRGQVLIEDPHTGDRFEVPAGSNYYWRIGGSQEFVGTETSSPELPNYWLHEMRVVD
jgi:hypothetical protein